MKDSFHTLLPVRDFVSSAQVPFWITGGWAIDLFVGHVTRSHGDVDVLVLDRDVSSMRPMYEQGLLRRTRSHEEVAWEKGERLEPGPDLLEPKPQLVGNQQVQIVIGLTDGEDWVYHRGNRSIRKPIGEIGLVGAHGLSYIAPEVLLLFKIRFASTKGEHAFNVTHSLLSQEQRSWLKRWVPEDHLWRKRLEN